MNEPSILPASFSRRLVVAEEPAIAEAIERLAVERGRSVAAEIRGAIREHLDSSRREEARHG